MTNRAVTIEPVSDALHPRVLGDLFLPSVSNGWGVLVLHGSSGRPDAHSARLLADVVQRSLLNDGSVSRGFLPKFAMFLWNSSGKESICSNPRVALESLCSADREGLKRHYCWR